MRVQRGEHCPPNLSFGIRSREVGSKMRKPEDGAKSWVHSSIRCVDSAFAISKGAFRFPSPVETSGTLLHRFGSGSRALGGELLGHPVQDGKSDYLIVVRIDEVEVEGASEAVEFVFVPNPGVGRQIPVSAQCQPSTHPPISSRLHLLLRLIRRHLHHVLLQSLHSVPSSISLGPHSANIATHRVSPLIVVLR